MTVLRPVCRRFPSSVGVWEETNLPLSLVVTPLAAEEEKDIATNPPPLRSIPKCLNCGAPQPTTTTQYPLRHSFLCHLCGFASTLSFNEQALARPNDGMFDNHVYQTKPKSGGDANNTTLDYTMPLFYDSKEKKKKKNDEVTLDEIPAMACPPLWWIVLDGSTTNRAYWKTIGQSLQTTIDSMPPHVHVGMVVSSSRCLSVWDLSNPVPLVRHYDWKQPIPPLAATRFVPAMLCKTHLQSALRALADSGPSLGMDNHDGGHLPLQDTLNTLLDTLQNHCQHPGTNTATDPTAIRYAGAKALIVLNGPPAEIGNTRNQPGHTAGAGGVGGSCSETGMRYDSQAAAGAAANDPPELTTDETDPEMGSIHRKSSQDKKKAVSDPLTDPTDVTPTNLAQAYPMATTVAKDFQQLGIKCAEAALGVDFLVLQQQQPPAPSKLVGVPFLRLLSERSGAVGPLVFDAVSDADAFGKELQSRAPWGRQPVGFGCLLRLRSSQGFQVDVTDVESSSEKGPQLGPLSVNRGLLGSASATKSDGLWQMGVCDHQQTVTIDLQVTNRLKMYTHLDGMGEVAIRHCVQICFAFTTVVYDAERNEYLTKRIMRVSSRSMPVVTHSEFLYAQLDPAALAVVLFHKLATATYSEGLWQTQDVGRNWLKYALVCAYKSAEDYFAETKSREERGFTLGRDQPKFFANERLLDRNGDLTDVEILLGHGNDNLRVLPLLVWGLLQSDSFRPVSGPFRPTIDARSAAMGQLASMPPGVLTRSIVPRLELWSSDSNAAEPIVDGLPLSVEAVALHLMEASQTNNNNDDKLVLFLDSPQRIVVCHSGHMRATQSAQAVVVSDALEQAVSDAVNSYRTAPPVTYALDLGTMPLTQVWQDAMVEDALEAGAHLSFDGWKIELAKEIAKEVIEADY